MEQDKRMGHRDQENKGLGLPPARMKARQGKEPESIKIRLDDPPQKPSGYVGKIPATPNLRRTNTNHEAGGG